jgi:lysophospholipase L1-like esterase
VNWIGDSTTIDGRPPAEFLYQLSLTSGLTLALQGSKTATNNNDSTGVTRGTIKCDAISGWTINQFYTDPASPFVFASVFDYAQYLTANGLTMAANDWVILCLGLNDIASYTDDINLNDKISTMITQLDAMIVSIKAAVSGVRIALFLTIPTGDQTTFGQLNGSGQTAWRFDRNRAIWVETMLTHYDARTAEKLYVFPYNAILDVPNNCQVMTGGNENTQPVVVTQNAYRPELTFQVSYNGVHPANYGYWQMGAAAFAFLKAQES